MKDEYNEIMHWLAYNYPGVYRKWSNKLDHDEQLKIQEQLLNKRWRKK